VFEYVGGFLGIRCCPIQSCCIHGTGGRDWLLSSVCEDECSCYHLQVSRPRFSSVWHMGWLLPKTNDVKKVQWSMFVHADPVLSSGVVSSCQMARTMVLGGARHTRARAEMKG
jgi:hypothetical protein